MSNDVFAVVADPTRRRILGAVKNGPRPVNDVVTELGVSQPTVSKHLKVLREAGLVTMEAQGQRRLYSLNPEPLRDLREWTDELVAENPEARHDVDDQSVVEDTTDADRVESVEAAEAPEVQETAAGTGRRRSGVVFTPLAPLGARTPTAGPEEVEEFASDLAPAVINQDPVPSGAENNGAQGDVLQEEEPAGSAASADWEPLDPDVRRPERNQGGQHVAEESKQSGFLANLFARKRGR